MRQLLYLIPIIALGSMVACEPGQVPGLPFGSSSDSAATASRTAATGDPTLVSLDDDEALRVYYQFTDERGRVRFVSTLAAVPEEWRARVGFVEMSQPPPMSPGDAQRIRRSKMAKLPSAPTRSTSSTQDWDTDSRRSRGVEVVIYSADWCGACRRAKRYMQDEGIDFIERNVDERQWKEEMIAKAGPGGIPVFDVDGQILRGFSPSRLDELIREAS